jgi:predicted neuraminidase
MTVIRQKIRLCLALILTAGFGWGCVTSPPKANRIVKTEFIFDQAPFLECHASTIVETGDNLVAAWFGGTEEKSADVGIWLSRKNAAGNSTAWSAPVEVANGVQPGTTNRFPCWNPVLFQPRNGPLLLFYKVGPSPSRWWGMVMKSTDAGKTWSQPEKLPDSFLGPIKDKPVQLADGKLLCPSSTEHDSWRLHMEFCSPNATGWTKTPPLNDGIEFQAIQPTILFHPGNRLQLLCRTEQKRIAESWSEDNGQIWSPLRATSLPNPNAGIDGVTTKDGRHFLVYNPTERRRTPLHVAVSTDGRDWKSFAVLEDTRGEFSYPAIIQTADGLLHVTYTWKRQRIKHVVLDPG